MLCLLLLMSACTQTCVSPEQCGKLCGTRGVLLFNSQNDVLPTRSLYGITNDSFDLDFRLDPLSIGSLIGLYLADASGEGAAYGSTGLVTLKSQSGSVDIQALVAVSVFAATATVTASGTIKQESTGGAPVEAVSGDVHWVLDQGVTNCIEGKLHTGERLTILDHLNNPIFEVRDDGTVHIPTGTAVIADL